MLNKTSHFSIEGGRAAAVGHGGAGGLRAHPGLGIREHRLLHRLLLGRRRDHLQQRFTLARRIEEQRANS